MKVERYGKGSTTFDTLEDGTVFYFSGELYYNFYMKVAGNCNYNAVDIESGELITVEDSAEVIAVDGVFVVK